MSTEIFSRLATHVVRVVRVAREVEYADEHSMSPRSSVAAPTGLIESDESFWFSEADAIAHAQFLLGSNPGEFARISVHEIWRKK